MDGVLNLRHCTNLNQNSLITRMIQVSNFMCGHASSMYTRENAYLMFDFGQKFNDTTRKIRQEFSKTVVQQLFQRRIKEKNFLYLVSAASIQKAPDCINLRQRPWAFLDVKIPDTASHHMFVKQRSHQTLKHTWTLLYNNSYI